MATSAEDQAKLDVINLLTKDSFTVDSAKDDLLKVEGESIKKYLEVLASDPHMSGSFATIKNKLILQWKIIWLFYILSMRILILPHCELQVLMLTKAWLSNSRNGGQTSD